IRLFPLSCYYQALVFPIVLSVLFSTLSLHDALPISSGRRGPGASDGSTVQLPRGGAPAPSGGRRADRFQRGGVRACRDDRRRGIDRKSTRLNSSHVKISYAVFCLKKKRGYIYM